MPGTKRKRSDDSSGATMKKKKSYTKKNKKSNTYSQTKPYYFKRTMEGWYNPGVGTEANLVASSSAAVTRGLYFRFGDLSNTTDFTGLFDQYKITGIRVKLIPAQNAAPPTISSTTNAVLYIAADYNDYTAPVSSSDVLEFQNVKTYGFNETVDYYFKPKVALAAYSGVFTSYAASNPWIDIGSPNVQHYGLKIYIPGVSANSICGWRILVTWYLAFRMVK